MSAADAKYQLYLYDKDAGRYDKYGYAEFVLKSAIKKAGSANDLCKKDSLHSPTGEPYDWAVIIDEDLDEIVWSAGEKVSVA